MAARTEVDVGGRRLRIGHLDRIVFPATGTTKGEVLDYYVRVADAMLPHLRDRLLHMHRYPEGVEGPRFWQKGCPENRPEWVTTAPVWSRDKGEAGRAARACARCSASSACAPGRRRPAARACRSTCRSTARRRTRTRSRSRARWRRSSRRRRRTVSCRAWRGRCARKVLVDWSQNTEHKSTVCAYSVRAKERPTVSTPLRWSEVEAAVDRGDAGGLGFEMGDVIERVAEHGDLFAPVLTERQPLRAGGPA